MILPGSETDQGWNQMAREGLDRIRAELGADTRLVTNIKSSEFAAQIEYFAADGYNLVICHGGEFQESVASAARKHPTVGFVVGGCPADIPGAVSVEFVAGEASRLVGVAAAQVTRKRAVAFVGAMPVPTLEACYAGLRDGVTSVAPDVKVLPALWTNSWDSASRAKEKAESAINDGGADVVFQNVDAAARGVFEAVKEASARGRPTFAFGCNSNQNQQAPDVILGSVVLEIQRTYLELAKEAQAGTLRPGHRKLGLAGGYVDLVLNDAHPQITDAVRQAVAAERSRLLAQK
mgnify:CR=1 FL=1